jgi:hypothetical protein
VHATNSCYVCEADDPEGLIRCTDCFGDHLYCTNCTLRIHHFTPLHRIKVHTFLSCLLPTLMRFVDMEQISLQKDRSLFYRPNDSSWARPRTEMSSPTGRGLQFHGHPHHWHPSRSLALLRLPSRKTLQLSSTATASSVVASILEAPKNMRHHRSSSPLPQADPSRQDISV